MRYIEDFVGTHPLKDLKVNWTAEMDNDLQNLSDAERKYHLMVYYLLNTHPQFRSFVSNNYKIKTNTNDETKTCCLTVEEVADSLAMYNDKFRWVKQPEPVGIVTKYWRKLFGKGEK